MTDGEDAENGDDRFALYPKGVSLGGGRYVFGELACGTRWNGLWSGRQLHPIQRDVLISFRGMPFARSRGAEEDRLAGLIDYRVPGTAPLLYFGPPDEMRPRSGLGLLMNDDLTAAIEARPPGRHLLDVGRLSGPEVVRLGVGLCDTVLGWAARRTMTCGLRRQTVFVVGEPGRRRYAGATTRSGFLFFGDGTYEVFAPERYEPPEQCSMVEVGLDEVVYTIACLLGFALTGDHVGGELVRRPLLVTGRDDVPPELGRLVDAALVHDPERRMKVPELRDELLQLGRAWNLDAPAFPPPELDEA